jgi:hypothetical protein
VAALRNLFWEISLGPAAHRSFAHSLVRVLVLFAPAASSSSPADAAVGGGIRRATDISRPSISHSLHNACGRWLLLPTTTIPDVSPTKVLSALISRGVGRNPVSRVTVGFQPREESRDAFVCRCPILPAVSTAD